MVRRGAMTQIGHGLSQIGREPGLRPVGNPWYTAQLPVKAKVAGTFSRLRPLVRDLLPLLCLSWRGYGRGLYCRAILARQTFCGVKEISSQ